MFICIDMAVKSRSPAQLNESFGCVRGFICVYVLGMSRFLKVGWDSSSEYSLILSEV